MIVLLRKYYKTFVAPTKYTVSLNLEIEYRYIRKQNS